MATEKKKDTESAAETPQLQRVEITLGKDKTNAKVFTSKGPLVTGSVVELPFDEAETYIEQGRARPSRKDEERIEPTTNVEKDDGVVSQ